MWIKAGGRIHIFMGIMPDLQKIGNAPNQKRKLPACTCSSTSPPERPCRAGERIHPGGQEVCGYYNIKNKITQFRYSQTSQNAFKGHNDKAWSFNLSTIEQKGVP